MSFDDCLSEKATKMLDRKLHADGLPHRLRLLCIAPQEPCWINLTLQLDAEGCQEPQFRWVSRSSDALATLHNESFDCVLVSEASQTNDVESNREIEAVSLLQAIRGSGYGDAVVFIATALNDQKWAKFCEDDCEILITAGLWESRSLVPVIKRALLRVELVRENHRLAVANHRRLVRERDEAEDLLKQQRRIIHDLEGFTASCADESIDMYKTSLKSRDVAGTSRPQIRLPREIKEYYHELLRTYVIMGSGRLGPEISKLAELMALAGLSPSETMALHLEAVETLVRGLGNRSARHVMGRADLLAMELMIHLGECYQKAATARDEAEIDSAADFPRIEDMRQDKVA